MKRYLPGNGSILFGLALILFWPAVAVGQMGIDREPIKYWDSQAADPIATLQREIDAGDVQLKFDPGQSGYLKSVLEALGVDRSSQTLVFSKTSFQLRRISPQTPRAIYFNDDVYIGSVQQGDVLELSAADPQLGAVFYTLAQKEAETPRFIRDQGNCLSCHASSRTRGVPGHLVRSVYPAASGMPQFSAGTFVTNQESPLQERWGGWYVTGTHGGQRHMGNVVAAEEDQPEDLDRESGANLTQLDGHFDTSRYLSGHSDIVALMVLSHQADMHNLITAASYTARQAMYQNESMNRILERPEGYLSESTERRIDNAAARLVDYMLFVNEAELTDAVRGTSGFAEQFAERGPTDRQDRSLRQFDLETRLFKYPCSYLVYSDAFRALPEPMKQSVYQRLYDVLTGDYDEDERYAHLTPADRQAIKEILLDTIDELPAYWQEVSTAG